MQKGKVIILSAPSGAGKTTLAKHLLNNRNDLAFSISCCTRAPRGKEQNGVEYYFLSIEEFKKKIANEELVEWEEVYANHFYGTLKSEVERIWTEGKNVIFDVDVVGGVTLKNKFKENALSIFVSPPSVNSLKERLIARNTDSEDKLKMRIAKAEKELTYAPKFDVVLINDDLERSKKEIERIVEDFLG